MIKVNWKLFEDLHFLVNTYAIRAEELSDNYYANLQIVKEERDAYSHFCSAFSKENEEEQKREFDFALSHQYRAVYDSLDWISIVFRQQISKVVRFNKKKAKELNVYKELKILSEEVALNRQNKGMLLDSTSSMSAITPQLQSYIDTIGKLDSLYIQILEK